jgi:hypothetical protein
MQDADVFILDLEPSVDSVRTARRAVARWAHCVGADRVVEDATLLVSELATNAVVHAGKPYTMVACWHPPLFRVEVIDAAPAPDLEARQPGATGGWGLQIVERLAHAWGVDDRGDHKAVWFDVEEPPRGGEVAPSVRDRS